MARTERTDVPGTDPFTGEPETASTAVAVAVPNASDLTYEALLALASEGEVISVRDLDDRTQYNKADLIGQPFIITDWSFNPEGNYGEFTLVKFTTPADDHGFFTDGSTGIKDQLKLWMDKLGGIRPIFVPKGLRVSAYTYTDPSDGKEKPAETYYISNEK